VADVTLSALMQAKAVTRIYFRGCLGGRDSEAKGPRWVEFLEGGSAIPISYEVWGVL